jgi:catechol 2,3-dioxygenase
VSEGGSIDSGTSMGAVRLVVADLDRLRDFYRDAIGLSELPPEDGTVRLGTDGEPIIDLVGEPDAPPRTHGTSGLFHLAILVPSRQDLARALQRVAEAGWRLSGASDHLVSEALYLSDPEGNGIELYRDRPREEWPVRDGVIQMDTLPLDLDGVLGDLRREDANAGMPPGTRIGHVHLNVGDLAAAEAFYSGALGFDVTVRGYPGALFVSAGGYHHHLAFNTWKSKDGGPTPDGYAGLHHVAIAYPTRRQLADAYRRLVEADWPIRTSIAHSTHDAIYLVDPDGNTVELMWDRPVELWPLTPEGHLGPDAGGEVDLDGLLRELD